MPHSTAVINSVTPEVKSFVFALPELRGDSFGERKSRRKQDKVEKQAAAFHSPTVSAMSGPNDAVHPQIRSILSTPSETNKESMYTSGASTDQAQYECDTLYSHSRKRKRQVSTSIRFSDIIGHASVKLRIDELILPLGLPSNISHSILKGIRSIPTSILLYGPPGCGKTKLAQAIAGEARSAFIPIAPSDVLSKFVGESEASIRNIFRKAVEMAKRVPSKCAVIFFDEIDALGQSRENSGTGEGEGCSRRVLTELLLQLNVIASKQEYCTEDFDSRLDALADTKNVEDIDEWVSPLECNRSTENMVRLVVVAATNRLEDCDAALLRRFGIQLEVRLPSLKDRKKILSKYLKEVDHNLSDLETHTLAAMTEHWSGSALENLAREAAMRPIRECLHQAAVIRRRAERLEQRGGDASGQDDVLESPDDAANICLLEGIQNLRPITVDDFCQSIAVMTGEEIAVSYPVPGRVTKKSTQKVEHYDSSSSSDSEH